MVCASRPELVSHLVYVNSFSFPSGPCDDGHNNLPHPWGITRSRIGAPTHEALLADNGYDSRPRGRHQPHISRSPLAHGRSGWMGAAGALACWLIGTWLQRRGAIEGEGLLQHIDRTEFRSSSIQPRGA